MGQLLTNNNNIILDILKQLSHYNKTLFKIFKLLTKTCHALHFIKSVNMKCGDGLSEYYRENCGYLYCGELITYNYTYFTNSKPSNFFCKLHLSINNDKYVNDQIKGDLNRITRGMCYYCEEYGQALQIKCIGIHDVYIREYSDAKCYNNDNCYPIGNFIHLHKKCDYILLCRKCKICHINNYISTLNLSPKRQAPYILACFNCRKKKKLT